MLHLFLLVALPCFGADLAARISPIAAKCRGDVSLYAKNLDTGETFGIRETERVRTASTIKLPILAAVYAAVAENKGKFTDELTLTEAEKVSGSGVLEGLSDGVRLPLKDVLHLMIVLSDNTATNMVLEKFPADLINAYLVEFGLKETKVLRKILRGEIPSGHSREGKREEFQRFGLGVSTPKEMVDLLEKLEKREIVSREASKQIIATLKRQQDNAGIQRRVDFPIASKAGALEKLRSDIGIVYAPWGRIAMAITVDDLPPSGYKPDNPGLLCIADLSAILVDGLRSVQGEP
jgi:beta-lactamase class A